MSITVGSKAGRAHLSHPLGSGKVTWIWQNTGYFVFVFVLSVYVTHRVGSVLNFGHTQCTWQCTECVLAAIILALPEFLFGTKPLG